jgi:alkylation response protein AidB-like acyl-CoA dehydrogenase
VPSQSLLKPAYQTEPLTFDSVAAALVGVLPEIEDRAAEADISGRFPAADIRVLSEIGLLSAFATNPREGPQSADRLAYAQGLFKCLRLIGGADLSLGRIFEGHVNAIALIERYGGRQWRGRLDNALAAGQLFGVWNTEPAPGVGLCQMSGQWLLSGTKTYATGAGSLDQAIVTARLPGGGKQMLVFPVGEYPDRADPGFWRTSGMRATVSGAYNFDRMPVDEERFLGEAGDYEREPMFTAGAWRFTAVQLGAIEALVTLFRSHLRESGRDADFAQRARFGRAVAAARTAFLWVREAAARAEVNPAPEAAAFVLMTRGVVEEAGLSVIQAVQRGVGTQAFFTENRTDRILRNLQLYLRQPAPDRALDAAAAAWLQTDCWSDDPWW